MKELDEFMKNWVEDALGVRPIFEQLRKYLAGQADVEFEFNARPGISYSLRAKHKNQQKHPLFVLIDIIDDEPEERWLSVCFFAESLTKEQRGNGDVVPGGLMGRDACCFDVSEGDEDLPREEGNFLVTCLTSAMEYAPANL